MKPLGFQNGWYLTLERAPLFLSLLLIFILPFTTQINGANPLYPKLVLTQMLVSLILSAWILKSVVTGKLTMTNSKALLPFSLLAAWILLTLFFSPYAHSGFNSLFLWLCFPLWYLCLTLTCLESWKAENILVAFLIGVLGTSLWAIAQAFGIDGGVWQTIVKNQFGGRVTAGLGNPDFLAGYLLIAWPLALALFQRASSNLGKWFWAGLLVLSVAALALTGSMAGWLGMAVGVLVYGLCLYIKGEKGKSNWQVVLMAMILVLLSAFFPPMFNRLKEVTSLQSDSIRFRSEVWKGVVEMIKDRPLTGTGFGTFEAAYPSYRPLSLMMRQSQRSYEVDQAHNWVLEWAAETGLVGLALLIWFWVMILFQWWKLFSANAIPRALGAGVFAAFAGIAANNLFDVNSHLPTTLVPLLFLAAFPVALSNRFHHLEGFPIRISEFDLSKTSIYLLPVVVLVAASSIHQIKTSFENQLADIQLKNAMTLSQQKKWDEAIPVYDRVLQLDKNNVMAMYFRGSAYFDRGNPGDNEKALWDYWAVSSIQPDYVLIHFKKAQVLDRLGKPEESKKEMKRAISLDPQLIFQVGEFKKAGQLAAAGKFTDAFDIYQKMVFDYPTCVPLLVDEGSCWVRLKKYRPAIAVYKTALGLDPQNQEAHQNLAAVQNLKEAGN